MTRSCTAPAPTPCTLGQGVFPILRHPGHIVGFTYRDCPVPVWAAAHLPESELTPVRERDLEEGLARAAEQMAAASGERPVSVLDALRRAVESMRP